MNNNLMTAGEAIRAFFRAYRLEDKILETRMISACEEVLGSVINKQVVRVTFRNHILSIALKNAAMKQELEYSKGLIIKNINEKMGSEIVRQVIIR